MTETPQTHTFRATTGFNSDLFDSAPTAVEYAMNREEAVSLLRDATALIAMGTPLRSHDIPAKSAPRWLEAPAGVFFEEDEDLAEAVDWEPKLASIRYRLFRLTYAPGSVRMELVGQESDTNAEVSSEIVTPEDLKEVFQITDEEVLPRVYLVQGKDFVVPGLETRVCSTEDAAKEHALDLVNDIRSSVGLAPALDASTFEEALQEAREARAAQTGVPVESVELDEDCNAEVWIEPVPLWAGAPPTLLNERKTAVEASGASPEAQSAPRRRPR